jgi:hypothetical protein
VFSARPLELRFGPYLRPRCRIGQTAQCLIRGEVRVSGVSGGPLRWPIGEKDGHHELIVYRSLAEAVRCERREAIAANWGVPVETVTRWQRALQPAPPLKPTQSKPMSDSFATWWNSPSQRQFSLLDLVFWVFWMAVLSALLRLIYDHTLISDKWHAATTCLAASIALAAAWGFASRIRPPAGQSLRFAVLGASALIASLLVLTLSQMQFSGIEAMALAVGTAALFLIGLKIGSR